MVRRAGIITGMVPLTSLQEIFERSVKKQSLNDISDPSHILHTEYEQIPSGRGYREPTCKLNRHTFTLIALLNTCKLGLWEMSGYFETLLF